MANYLHIIPVKKEQDKCLYKIMKDLSRAGESFIEDASSEEWQRTFINIGRKMKPLIDTGYLEPIWKTDKRGCNSRLIRTGKNITVEEKIVKDITKFRFVTVKPPKRRRLI